MSALKKTLEDAIRLNKEVAELRKENESLKAALAISESKNNIKCFHESHGGCYIGVGRDGGRNGCTCVQSGCGEFSICAPQNGWR